MLRVIADMKSYPRYLDWLRYFCALMLFAYGVSKLTGHQFSLPSDIARKPIGSLSGYTLTWYGFGYSHLYRYILGSIQIVGACLLLFRKSALLGALMMLPVMANILLINIFYSIAFGAECNAALILASMLLMLWHQRRQLTDVLWTGQAGEPPQTSKAHWRIRSLILLLILALTIFSVVHRVA